MAQALHHAAEVKREPLETRKDGYQWTLRDGIYTVTGGGQTVAAPIRWVFGSGVMGQTYLYERGGAYYEATLSHYTKTGRLDYTPGHLDRPRRDIEEAAGRKIDPSELRRCFGCHASSEEEPLAAGVQCEQCHAGAGTHAATMPRTTAKMPSLRTSTSEEISTLCGACHRTWEDIAANGPRGVLNVRFQPYRLANSKCYDAVDRRISCTACHDPHGAIRHDAAFYDSKCMACHAGQKQCSVSTKECVTCHMPKVSIPGIHFEFRDHRIRIARAGAPYPD